MAGTVTKSEITHQPIKKITFTWTSSAGGQADAETAEFYTGRVIYAVQIPDGGGTQPTDQYDVVVTDADGVDVLKGLGANLSNAANTYKADSDGLGAVVESKLTLAVTGAGNAKGGKTILFIR
jgi:hypothetical protein